MDQGDGDRAFAHPGVSVHLRQAPAGSAGLAAQVIAGELDLALMALPGQAPAGLRLEPLSEEPLVLIAAPGHPLAGQHRITLAQLAGEDFVDFPPGWGNRTLADRAFAAAGLDRRVPFEVAEFVSAALIASPLIARSDHQAAVFYHQRGMTRPDGDLGAKHSAVQEIADAHGVSPQQVTLAWMLALAAVVIPIPGASRPASITDSAQAADLVLSGTEVARLSEG